LRLLAAGLLATALGAGAQEVTLTTASAPRDATFRADRQALAIRCADRTVQLYDLPGGSKRATLGPVAEGTSMVRLSADGRVVATAGERPELELWDAATGKSLRRSPLAGHAYSLSLSSDGARVAAGNADAEVVLWDGAAEKRLPLGGEAQDLAFSPDGSLLAAAGADALVRVFHVPDGRLVATLDDAVHSQFALAFSPDGRRLASVGADGSARVYDTAGWKTVSRTAAGRIPGAAIGFHGAGEVFAVFVPVAPGPRPTWLRWNLATGAEERGELPAGARILGGSSDGQLVAIADGDRVRVTALPRPR